MPLLYILLFICSLIAAYFMGKWRGTEEGIIIGQDIEHRYGAGIHGNCPACPTRWNGKEGNGNVTSVYTATTIDKTNQ